MPEARLALYQTAMLPMYFSDGVDSFSINQGQASDTVREVESTFCFLLDLSPREVLLHTRRPPTLETHLLGI